MAKLYNVSLEHFDSLSPAERRAVLARDDRIIARRVSKRKAAKRPKSSRPKARRKPMTKARRSAAAKKGWATRRRNMRRR